MPLQPISLQGRNESLIRMHSTHQGAPRTKAHERQRARDDVRERRAGKRRRTQLRNASAGSELSLKAQDVEDVQTHTAQKSEQEGTMSDWKHELEGIESKQGRG